MKYYAWIPTIVGYLDFKLIGKSEFFSEKNISENPHKIQYENLNIDCLINDRYIPENTFLSSNPFTYPIEKTYPQFLNFSIVDRGWFFKGIIKIDSKLNGKKQFVYGADFLICHDGRIVIKNYKSYGVAVNKNIKANMQTLYVIIKNIVHNHKHHWHKIDTVIRVTTNKKILYKNVINNMITQLKEEENNIIKLDKVLHHQKIKEIDAKLDGFLAYGRTLCALYEKNSKTTIGFYENTIASIKATIKNAYVRKERDNNMDIIKWSIIPISISFGLLIKDEKSPSLVFICILGIYIFIVFLDRIIKHYYHNIVYDNYQYLIEEIRHLQSYNIEDELIETFRKYSPVNKNKKRYLTRQGFILAKLLKYKRLNLISYSLISFYIVKFKIVSFFNRFKIFLFSNNN